MLNDDLGIDVAQLIRPLELKEKKVIIETELLRPYVMSSDKYLTTQITNNKIYVEKSN